VTRTPPGPRRAKSDSLNRFTRAHENGRSESHGAVRASGSGPARAGPGGQCRRLRLPSPRAARQPSSESAGAIRSVSSSAQWHGPGEARMHAVPAGGAGLGGRPPPSHWHGGHHWQTRRRRPAGRPAAAGLPRRGSAPGRARRRPARRRPAPSPLAGRDPAWHHRDRARDHGAVTRICVTASRRDTDLCHGGSVSSA
jgi:hypothetical protein